MLITHTHTHTYLCTYVDSGAVLSLILYSICQIRHWFLEKRRWLEKSWQSLRAFPPSVLLYNLEQFYNPSSRTRKITHILIYSALYMIVLSPNTHLDRRCVRNHPMHPINIYIIRCTWIPNDPSETDSHWLVPNTSVL